MSGLYNREPEVDPPAESAAQDREIGSCFAVPPALVGEKPPRPTGYPRDLWANLTTAEANRLRYRMGFEGDDADE